MQVDERVTIIVSWQGRISALLKFIDGANVRVAVPAGGVITVGEWKRQDESRLPIHYHSCDGMLESSVLSKLGLLAETSGMASVASIMHQDKTYTLYVEMQKRNSVHLVFSPDSVLSSGMPDASSAVAAALSMTRVLGDRVIGVRWEVGW